MVDNIVIIGSSLYIYFRCVNTLIVSCINRLDGILGRQVTTSTVGDDLCIFTYREVVVKVVGKVSAEARTDGEVYYYADRIPFKGADLVMSS